MESKSVLLVTVDSLRADHLRSYGYGLDTSPSLDRLAGSSWLFESAYSVGPNTHPSFPGTLTSTYPNLFPRGTVSGYLEMERTTLAEVLRGASYSTGGFHSNPFLSSYYGYDRGFDKFEDFLITGRTKSSFDGKDDDLAHLARRAWDLAVAGKPPFERAETITRSASSWIDQCRRPFFAWVHYMDVHMPYMPPEGYLERIGRPRLGRLAQMSIGRQLTGARRNSMSPARVAKARDLYDASIRYMDDHVGALVDNTLRANPETIVIFTADHGEEFMDHGGMGHGHKLYDELVRVPLVIRTPGARSRRVAKPVSLADVPVFILEMLGVKAPPSFQGKSLIGRMTGEVAEPVFFETLNPHEHALGLREGKWKYIQGRTEHLFDLALDPKEANDVAPTEQETVGRLRSLANAHLQASREHRAMLHELCEAGRVRDAMRKTAKEI